MPSVKIVLKENQAKKDGTYPVLIRVIVARKVKYFSTGYSVKSSQFREGSENWVYKHSDAVLINRAIERKRSQIAEKIYLSEIEGRRIEISDLGKRPRGATFFGAIKNRMDVLARKNQVAMYNRLHAKLGRLKQAWRKDVNLRDLSAKLVDQYVSFRIENGMSVNTIKKDLTDLSNVLSNTDDYDGRDWFKLASKKLTRVPVEKEKLTLSEVKELEGVRLTGLNDVARDMFLFSFYCQGMRFQNVAMFRESQIQGGFIRYQMNKGRKFREVEIHSKLQKLIDKYRGGRPYLFPVVKKEVTDNWSKKNLIDNANALINAHLKRVAIIAGIEKNLSTHIARHTFASLSLQKGVSIEILKDALGHSDYHTTQVYLKALSDDKINEAVRVLYE